MKAYAKRSGMNGSVVLTEVPHPEAGADEISVKIAAIGVGIHDEYFHAPNVSYPYVIGIEAAGVIEAIGQRVSGYQPGDRIAFVSIMQPKGGTWAEYAVIAANSLILRMPENMSFEQAAALPVVGNTVLKALRGAALKPGESLFIAGGAGALGTLLIQIAAARGYTVIASASKKNHEYTLSLGANHVVDYHDSDWQEQLRAIIPNGVDAAIAIHPGTPMESQAVVKDGGTLIAVSGDQFVPERGIILKQVLNDVDVRDELQELMNKVVSGNIKLTMAQVYPFTDALTALEQVKTRHTRGKLVVTLANNQ
jgi:NADPH:quinone reductase-like Zn-dependent oxidoreductase